jgi:NADH-quinone oxidoreductase subunit J
MSTLNLSETLPVLLFVLFGGLAIGCAVSMVAQRNPLYSAVSLIGVFAALACLYLLLAAPFIAAVQIIVYAGAIMVLVVFVIMLLNVEEEVRRPARRTHLAFVAVLLGAVLVGEALFMLTIGGRAQVVPQAASREVGLTTSIGTGLFTEYLLPFEITSVLILMALVGAISLARQVKLLGRSDFAGGELAIETGGARARGGDRVLQPGHTEATGQAMAEAQIARGDASAPAQDERTRVKE